METAKARAFQVSLVYSDFWQTYYASKMERVCEADRCFVYEVTHNPCDVYLVLFPDHGQEELGPTGVGYSFNAKDGAGLRQAIADAYVISDKETKRPLFGVSRLIDAERAAAACDSKPPAG